MLQHVLDLRLWPARVVDATGVARHAGGRAGLEKEV